MSQVPAAVANDDDITPDEFLRVPVRAIADSAADGRFDILVLGRGFAATLSFANGGIPELRWQTVPGHGYRLWRSSSLVSGSWQVVATSSAGPAEWEKKLVDPAQGSAFYRIELTSASD